MLKNILHLDYETFSELNLKEVGAHKYARDPSTEIICAAWAIDDGPVQLITEHDDGKALRRALKKCDYVAGHNVGFEYLISKFVGRHQFNLPKIDPKKLICTAALSSYRGFPRALDGVAQGLGLVTQKDPRGSRLIAKLCKPRRPSKFNPATRWTPATAPQDFADFYAYCIQDVIVERGVHHTLGALPKREQEIWLRDFHTNARGIPINVALLEKAIACREFLTEKLEAKAVKGKPFNTLGQRAVVMQWCADKGYPLDDYTADTIAAAIADKKCPKAVRKVLIARQQCSRSSLKKFDAMRRAVCPDGTVKGAFIYYGAHTGRWSGSLIQPQNLPRPMISEADITRALRYLKKGQYEKFFDFDDPTGALVSCIRPMIQPEPGLRMFASDFSNIEGRVLFALALELGGLKVFADGLDLYCDMAAKIFGKTYKEVHDAYKSGDDYMRFIGKTAVLGLGYGMGWKTFRKTALDKGIEMSVAFARQIVTTYREAYPGVTEFWEDCEQAAKDAIKKPGKVFYVNKYIAYKVVNSVLLCELPSGRKISYPFPTIELRSTPWGAKKPTVTFMTYEKGAFRRVKTFGGSLVENIVQGEARDLLCAAEDETERRGYDTRMTVHDELVLTTDSDGASEDDVTDCMINFLPGYAKGWPIGAGTWEGPRYRKD